jgi:hypothetical protein
MVEIQGDVTPMIGSLVEPDGWKLAEMLCPSDWDKADFYLHTGHEHGVTKVAVNIKVTGRKTRRRYGNQFWVRIRIEFVGDGEPSKFHGGWLKQD